MKLEKAIGPLLVESVEVEHLLVETVEGEHLLVEAVEGERLLVEAVEGELVEAVEEGPLLKRLKERLYWLKWYREKIQ